MSTPATLAGFADGGCDCRAVRYRLTSRPMFVHCCHCRWCQRESGAAFALNALIEADRVLLLSGAPHSVPTPSSSGRGQKISRCPECQLALWSTYAGAGDAIRFIRVGTLDDPERCPPDVHIYVASRQPWVLLPPAARAYRESYDRREVWPADSLARRAAAMLAPTLAPT
ncbi:MAG: GFA family protein [Gammaproteobacteria bacterium]|nr:GFA family protein [Gammaproteobacteria bacterium]